YLGYEMGFPEERRDLLKKVTSNREVDGKNIGFRLAIPFDAVANRSKDSNSRPSRDIPRTWDRLITVLWDWIRANPAGALLPSEGLQKNGTAEIPDVKEGELAA
ncbi:MAG: hypothetical protein ACREA0_31055, partial [bacterium]